VASHKVVQRILTGAEVLETVDWAGRFIPLVPVYGEELHIDGRRRLRSLVRDAKDPQRMFNYWRTTSTELVALAPKTPFIGRKGAFETDSAKWATANVQTHAYIEYDGPEPPQRQMFAGPPAGAVQEALTASDDMKAIMGLYDASLGARSNETSGRAIMARQREGDVSTFHYIDNLNRSLRHAGRILIDLIPKVYATPRVIRVLGADGQARAVNVNSSASAAPSAASPPAAGAQADPNGELKSVERIYDLTVGRYDLTVEAGPSFTSRREEAANQMIELIQAYPAAARRFAGQEPRLAGRRRGGAAPAGDAAAPGQGRRSTGPGGAGADGADDPGARHGEGRDRSPAAGPQPRRAQAGDRRLRGRD
jgi:hypothetical protein